MRCRDWGHLQSWGEQQGPRPPLDTLGRNLTLWRLLLHVGAGQVAVHESRLAAGQVPHDALEQKHASATAHVPHMCPSIGTHHL